MLSHFSVAIQGSQRMLPTGYFHVLPSVLQISDVNFRHLLIIIFPDAFENLESVSSAECRENHTRGGQEKMDRWNLLELHSGKQQEKTTADG